MATLLDIPIYHDARGSLGVIEKIVPFEIKRVYFMYEVTALRGGHRHKKTLQALICVKGQCEVYVNDGKQMANIELNSPSQCLILQPEDWHTMDKFSSDAVLLVLASEYYDKDDYIEESWDD